MLVEIVTWSRSARASWNAIKNAKFDNSVGLEKDININM